MAGEKQYIEHEVVAAGYETDAIKGPDGQFAEPTQMPPKRRHLSLVTTPEEALQPDSSYIESELAAQLAALDDPEDIELDEIEAEAQDEPAEDESIYSLDTVRQLGARAAQFELLTSRREKELAQTIERGLAAAAQLKGDSLELPPEERLKLERLVKQGAEAKSLFIDSNYRLSIALAAKHNFKTPLVPLEDLIQAANIGLIRSVEKFDWRKGYKFSTYATWWIKQSCQRAIARYSRLIRLPVDVHQHIIKIGQGTDKFYKEFGFMPDDNELSEYINLPINVLVMARAAGNLSTVSSNLLVGENNDMELGDFQVDKTADTAQEAIDNISSEDPAENPLAALVAAGLNPLEEQVIKYRFGYGCDFLSLKSTGKATGLTPKEVRQVERSAQIKLEKYYGVYKESTPSKKADPSPAKAAGALAVQKLFSREEVAERTRQGLATPLDQVDASFWHNPDGSFRFDEEALGDDF